MSTLRSSPSFARQDPGAFVSRVGTRPGFPTDLLRTGQLPSVGNSAVAALRPCSRPAADLSFGDTRFGFALGSAGL